MVGKRELEEEGGGRFIIYSYSNPLVNHLNFYLSWSGNTQWSNIDLCWGIDGEEELVDEYCVDHTTAIGECMVGRLVYLSVCLSICLSRYLWDPSSCTLLSSAHFPKVR